MHVVLADCAGQHVVDPRAGGIDQQPRLDLFGLAGPHVLDLDRPEAVFAARADHLRAGPDRRAAVGGVAGVQRHQPRIVDPAVGIFERLAEQRLQRLAGRIAAHVQRPGRRQQFAPADVVVEEQAEPDQPGRAQPLGVRQHEAHRPDDVRRHSPQHLALHQRFAHQAELVVFEIAQAAMDQLGRAGRGAAGEIVHLGEEDRKAAPDGIAGDAATVDATTYDENVMDSPIASNLAPPAISHCSIFGLFETVAELFRNQERMSNEISQTP